MIRECPHCGATDNGWCAITCAFCGEELGNAPVLERQGMRVAALEAEVERLRAALAKYGTHQPGCNWNETIDYAVIGRRLCPTCRGAGSWVPPEPTQGVTFTEADLREAFRAGAAWRIGDHQDFKQTHPDEDAWVAAKLKERA